MKGTILFLAVALAAAGAQQRGGRIEVAVDPRVELMSIIFRLAGNREYNQPNSRSPYSRAVKEHFEEFAEHPVVRRAAALRRNRGVSFDAVMSMAMHIRDTRRMQELIPFDRKPERLDRRWPLKEARLFLEEARDFAAKSDFNGFFRRQGELYTQTAARMRKVLAQRPYVSWFDTFFGARRQAKFVLSPGLLLGGSCYGSGIRHPNGREVIHPVIGVWKFDEKGIPLFHGSIAGTVAHELCHSYTNPIVDRHADKLEAAGKKIFATCAAKMRRMAYGSWKTMIYESLVRACVVQYLAATGGDEAAAKEVERQHGRGFLWVGGLAELLEEYESGRKKYRRFDDFMPRVAAFFDDYAEEAEKQAADTPRVVSMTPANGAADVDPGLKEIIVVFDRPMMDRMWSVVGGGPHFPEMTGKVHYRKDMKTFVIPVKLKPDWSYRFWLNRGKYNTFRSREGVPLSSVAVRFETRAAK